MIDGGRPAAGQTKRYAQKREAILDAAARHFNARGIRGTALNDVGGSVGLMPNSITYYYRRKEDLAAACYVSTIAWHEALLAETAASADPPRRLSAFLAAYFRDLAAIEIGARPPQVRLTDMRALPEPQSAMVYAAYNAFFRQARTAFFPEAAFPGLDRDALNARTHLVISVVHTVRAWIDRYEAADYPRVGERVADLLLRGLAGPESRWSGDAPDPVTAPADPTEPFLRAATALINAEGYRGASVEKISARLSVTKGSFYHHNDNKDDLIAQCFARTFEILRREQEAAEAAGGSGWMRITACARALMRHQVSERGPLLRCTAVGALPDSLRAEIPLTMRRLWERLAFPIGDGIADGSIRAIDPSIAAQVVSSMIDAASDLDRWCEVEGAHAADVFARPLFVGVYAPAG
ncbi:HTH-type transcriptional regulator BetI [Methylobacterium cerastii]|uniref:HTH-type transcriptional regulator BetI n=1 Tax=Methylobacterium cerastii TaxID=932741 RepID=A0ABQ4QJN5_9HYPH|nr:MULTISPECIES: TetR/AcrR family transcriptional regulator [Methylobacterium]TXM69939.1 TetR/AcrR family transcriptional regulator [Methylobacterium sp. WL12]TXM94887.1 TetR/AcrR family transcriptional regulator [Methylobacterium sp. WL103]GJD45464.1 HTH-type transcriptional regulator BetI [Methylobacterium cerastii]